MNTLTIGTDSTCDLRPSDPYVSPRHAVIGRRADQTYWIDDLGSTNGTWVQRGGMQLKIWGPFQLLPGDIIRIGRTQFPWDVPHWAQGHQEGV